MAISTVTLNIGLTTSKNHFVEAQRGTPIFTTDAEVAVLADWIFQRLSCCKVRLSTV